MALFIHNTLIKISHFLRNVYNCFENIQNDDDMRLQLFSLILYNVEAASVHHP